MSLRLCVDINRLIKNSVGQVNYDKNKWEERYVLAHGCASTNRCGKYKDSAKSGRLIHYSGGQRQHHTLNGMCVGNKRGLAV